MTYIEPNIIYNNILLKLHKCRLHLKVLIVFTTCRQGSKFWNHGHSFIPVTIGLSDSVSFKSYLIKSFFIRTKLERDGAGQKWQKQK